MSHIILTGSVDRHPGLPERLLGWGYTVGGLGACPPDAPDAPVAPVAPDVPDVGMCDVVLHVGTAGVDPGAMPDGAQEAGGAVPAAPLLLLGAEGPLPGVFETLPDPGPAWVLLRAALARAEARARELREGPGGDDRRDFHQFLGHELRSPLAALKTALDVVGREGGVDPAVGRMLDLATRNVDRLAGAVEWSQDLRELEEAPPEPRLREVPLRDLVERLEAAGRRIGLAADPSRAVVTDPELMAAVVGQMERALALGHPGGEVGLVIVAEGEGLVLVLSASGDPRPVGGLQMGETGGGIPEIERLARLMCSPCLLQVLGLDPRAHTAEDGRSGLAVTLPLAAPVPTA